MNFDPRLPIVAWLGGAVAIAGTALLVFAACGSDPASPEPDPDPVPAIVRVQSPVSADTIDAEPTVAYTVVVQDGDGGVVSGAQVVFSAVNMRVAVGGGAFGTSAIASTDASGEASASLKFGTRAGPGRVSATVGSLSLADTVELTVSAGAGHALGLTPGDTTVARGVPFTAVGGTVDRHGNLVSEATVEVESGPLSVTGMQLVGDALGSGIIFVAMGGDTIRSDIRIVPDGEIAVISGEDAWVVGFDGTGRSDLPFTVPGVREPSVDWSPDGDRIVVGGLGGFRVFDLTTSSVSPAGWPGGTAGGEVIWPRFDPTGSRIIYSTNDGSGWDLREAAPDGTSASILIAASDYPEEDLMPDWSPDGDQFVFTSDRETNNYYLLRIVDDALTTTSTIPIEGVTPVWSPDGSMIAYQELGVVGVVSPDGVTVDRSWNPGWSKGPSWSPDSDLLVGLSGGRIQVIDVETGALYDFPELGVGVDAVGWRPR